ncbi:MAG TPA: pitrilysin family protein [Pyrinomonadaceae bacterium]|nr:pitrilysin family protein [Pyrinomonadaceae bacterium]
MALLIRGSLIASVLLALCFAAFAQAPTAGGFAAQAASVTEFEVNGLKVIVKRRASAPTVAGGLFIRGGARNINEKDAGIENLMLASAVEAGQKIPRATVRRELASMGSAIVSGVTNDFGAVQFVTTRANFDRVWEIFSEVTMNPAFAQQDIELNRKRILASLNEAGISPEGALQTLEERVLYAGHPYANDVSGTTANISRFTAAELRAYHKNVMQTSRLLLVVVGDVDPDQLKSRVASTFAKLPRGDYKEQPLAALDFSKGTLNATSRTLPTTYVQGAFSAPSLRDPDYNAMRVAISILASLVNQEVRDRRQLSYAPEADMNNYAANTAKISVSSTDPNQAVSVMLEQIKLLQNNTLPDDIIDDVSDFFLTKHYLSLETNSSQVGELARYELIGGGWRNSFEFLNGIRSVKPSDIRAVSNKYMKNIRFAVVGNEAALNKSIFIPAE